MVMIAPEAAEVGAKEAIAGGGININPFKIAEPPGVVTLTAPEDPAPTCTRIDEADTTVNADTGVPPSASELVPFKLFPLMVRIAPDAAELGAKEVIAGGGINMNPFKLADPPRVVKLIAPVDPAPTCARIDEADTTVNADTGVPPKASELVPFKLFPLMVMIAPDAAVVGTKEVIAGGGININPFKLAEPPGVVTLTAPVDPAPTCARIDEADTTVNADTGVPPNASELVPFKLFPLMVMIAPDAAVVGIKEVIAGGGININPFKLADPPGVVMLKAPLEPLPTVATMELELIIVNAETKVPPKLIIDVPLK